MSNVIVKKFVTSVGRGRGKVDIVKFTWPREAIVGEETPCELTIGVFNESVRNIRVHFYNSETSPGKVTIYVPSNENWQDVKPGEKQLIWWTEPGEEIPPNSKYLIINKVIFHKAGKHSGEIEIHWESGKLKISF